jgi:peptide chain release factor 2
VILFDVAGKEKKLADLEAQTLKPGFWDDQNAAQGVLSDISRLRNAISVPRELTARVNDLAELLEMAVAEGDDEETLAHIVKEAQVAERDVAALELQMLLSEPYDHHSAIVTFHPGAGGTESQDWAEMLLRMYTRWGERHGYEVEVLDLLPGEEAGIKSATVRLAGELAYGYLKAEAGVHRLVRISPFDAAGRRHTSFASVEVMPEVEDENEVQIDPKDLRIDTYRSGGAGGQHINKTDSAVRITHIPTGIVVQCQNERSQHSNRETAMKVLRSRLLEVRLAEQEAERAKIRGDVGEIAWGNQIRSYVFHPYTLVKDHRTDFEVGNIQAVMDGELDDFINAYLGKRAAGQI